MTDKFLEPDSIWKIWGIKTQKDFLKKHLITGKFHKGVPEEIKKDYHTVERLLYYSYYYYPLKDEAFRKLAFIFEASINLKVNELGAKCSQETPRNLKRKIEFLQKHFPETFIKDFLFSKEMRNNFAHPKAGQLYGRTLQDTAFMDFINNINFIFLDKEDLTLKEEEIKKLYQELNFEFLNIKTDIEDEGEKKIISQILHNAERRKIIVTFLYNNW